MYSHLLTGLKQVTTRTTSAAAAAAAAATTTTSPLVRSTQSGPRPRFTTVISRTAQLCRTFSSSSRPRHQLSSRGPKSNLLRNSLASRPSFASPSISFSSPLSTTAIMASAPPPSGPQRRFERPAIFVCDIQDKFRSAIWNFDAVVATSVKVLRAAHALGLPVHTTTQNGARLGDTVPELKELLFPEKGQPQQQNGGSNGSTTGALVYPSVDKTRFSMWVPEVAARFEGGGGPSQVIIVGIESHICVTQTALDLLRAGHAVYVLADGVSSCNREEVGVALARLRHEGATVTTSESVLYELMGDAKVPEFKGIVGIVKETAGSTKKSLQALL